ncbi:MAG: hypothetical protein U5L74_13255 [Ideonella sp.]|nr:hypothetical protein [Ideonella sp.]
MPGANPAFGLNSLGGAIAMTTASGRTAPGLRADLSLGSFGRKRLDASHGAVHEGGWNHYVAVGGFDESGWRDHSKGELAHLNASWAERRLGPVQPGPLARPKHLDRQRPGALGELG